MKESELAGAKRAFIGTALLRRKHLYPALFSLLLETFFVSEFAQKKENFNLYINILQSNLRSSSEAKLFR